MKHLLKIIKLIALLLLNGSLSTSLLIAAFCPPPTVNCMCPPGEVCSCMDTQCACQNTQCTCDDPQCACQNTQCACTDPQCTCDNTQCACTDPQCACQNTQCACTDPQCTCDNTQCACTDPQCACQNTQCACTDPQCACSNEQCQCPPGGLISFGTWFLDHDCTGAVAPSPRTMMPGDNVEFPSQGVVPVGIIAAPILPSPSPGGTGFTLPNIGTYIVSVGMITTGGSNNEFEIQLNGVGQPGTAMATSNNNGINPLTTMVTTTAVNMVLTVTLTGVNMNTKMCQGQGMGNQAFISIAQISS